MAKKKQSNETIQDGARLAMRWPRPAQLCCIDRTEDNRPERHDVAGKKLINAPTNNTNTQRNKLHITCRRSTSCPFCLINDQLT